VGRTLASEVTAFNGATVQINAFVMERFCEHRAAAVITVVLCIDETLGAEFITAAGGDLAVFSSPN
jgi:hypothetical protein